VSPLRGGEGTLARLGYTPQWALLPQFQGSELCRDAEGARNYDDDPLNYHDKLKVRIALQTMQAMRMNRPHFPEYTLPILCMHGTKDVTTSLAAAEAFVQVGERRLTVA
jgi:alpha-beta hydrolase superfamily lysophospholipase